MTRAGLAPHFGGDAPAQTQILVNHGVILHALDRCERALACSRQAISSRMAENMQRLYRAQAPVTALEDFLERAVRG